MRRIDGYEPANTEPVGALQVTQWFVPGQNPVHLGVYERRAEERDGGLLFGYAHWTGTAWIYTKDSAYAHQRCIQQRCEWRGIAK